MRIFKVLLALCGFTLVIGCSHLENLEMGLAHRYGAEDMVDRKAKIAPLDLITLLDPENKLWEVGRCQDLPDADPKKLNCAFQAFYDKYPQATQKSRRDRIQDRLLSASNEQCRQFKLRTKLARDTTNLVLGGITTLTAGLGAIFTPVNTVRALSGSASIVSGIRAETLQTIYAEKTVEVLTAAIDKRRKNKFGEIQEKRAKPIEDYTVEAAISDATEYHAACTFFAALEEISAGIEKPGAAVPTPGIAVSPNPLNFDQPVSKGSEATKKLKISNNTTGAVTVNITKASRGTDFTVDKDSVTVPPNDSKEITVTFKPSEPPGTKTEILTVKPTDPKVPGISVSLTGTGQ
jgi:hypothetical protein